MSEEEREKLVKQFKEQKTKEINESHGIQNVDLPRIYDLIIKVLKNYADLREDYFNILSLWVIGTYAHKQFNTFPYLFLNAMKGSGKTRLLRLLASMSYNGKVVANVSEAVLFRTASFSSIFIDEFEHISKKGKETLRELLNAGYKKGTKVERAYKIKSGDRESQAVESFEVYCPICMANIEGMENVLLDRCIPLIIDKSDNLAIIKKIEDYDQNPDILEISTAFPKNWCSLCSVVTLENMYKWNNYIDYKYNYTTTHTTLTTLTTQTTLTQEELDFFNKIDETGIDSRNLELFLPLFFIAKTISNEIFEETLKTAKIIVEERKAEDIVENRDVSLLNFLSQRIPSLGFINIIEMTNDFRGFMEGESEEEDKWLNSKWVGRSLKRLNLVIEKRRMGKGVQVILDFGKVKEKINMLKPKKDKI